MLKIGNKKNEITFLGSTVDLDVVSPKEFLIANMTVPVEFEKDLMLGSLVEKIGYIKEFAQDCFSENLDVLAILVGRGTTIKKYSKIKLHKTIERDENGYVFFVNTVEFVESEDGTNVLRNIFVEIDENIEDGEIEPVLKEKSKIKFTLFDVLSVLFEEVLGEVRGGGLLI